MSDDRSRGIRRCAPGSSAMPRVRCHRPGKQDPLVRSLKQKCRAARLVWKTRLEFAQRSCTCHWAPPRARRMWPDARLLYIIWGSLGPVKPCRAIGLFSPKVVNDSADAEGAEHPKYHQRIKNYGYCHGYCTFRSSSCISVNHDDMPDMTFFLTKRIFISFVTS